MNEEFEKFNAKLDFIIQELEDIKKTQLNGNGNLKPKKSEELNRISSELFNLLKVKRNLTKDEIMAAFELPQSAVYDAISMCAAQYGQSGVVKVKSFGGRKIGLSMRCNYED